MKEMKKFGEVVVGDKIYRIDDDFRIREVWVSGVEDIDLRHNKVKLTLIPYSLHREITVGYDFIKHSDNDVVIFSCLEAAQEYRDNQKRLYAAKQMRIAITALRRVKKVIPDMVEQKKRICELFQMIDKDENK